MDRFSFASYVSSFCAEEGSETERSVEGFYRLCERVRAAFYKDWDALGDSGSALEIQKKAITGCEREKTFFKTRILQIVDSLDARGTAFPSWYSELSDAVYHENWGLAGLAEWFSPAFCGSSSAKIVADRIYFMDGGRMRLMPQRIERSRLDQMIRAFLLLSPRERMDRSYYETYMLDGTRVTIYTEPMVKADQPCIVLRRYLIPKLSFEEQAARGTIPKAAIPLFKAMVEIGFNVAFIGAVRTAKTTFLSTWQSCEDPHLEGVMVETDPEIPLHRILPDSPIMQLIADGEELRGISKNLLRSDADYFILAEARDGIALDTAVRLAAKGTKRMKMTFHSRRPDHFALEAATEIVKSTGGDLGLTMCMVASSFDYIFHFVSPGSDRSVKKLDSIYQMSCGKNGAAEYKKICSYDYEKGCWYFTDYIGEDKLQYAKSSSPEGLERMKQALSQLSGREAV
ncbi:MAG: ATPase [Firmicutes bacterium]|nr:ATPase [Bacillota bacterium]